MSTNNLLFTSTTQKRLWIIFATLFFVFGSTLIFLEKPLGALAGKVSIKKESYGVGTYSIKAADKVYALASGRSTGSQEAIERGVWVKSDGSFQINNLPVGEYSIRIKAPGFSTNNQYGLYVEEGKVTQINNSELTLLDPSGSLACSSRVFTTKENPYFWVNANGAERAVVKIYKKDMLPLLLEGSQSTNPLKLTSSLGLYKPTIDAAKIFEKEQAIETIERKLNPDYNDWARADIKLSNPLQQGDYIAVLEVYNIQGKRDWNVMWFSVSDLGLVIKQAPEKTLVRAIDLNTLKARPGVSVQLFDRDLNGKSLGTKTTQADGFAVFAVPANQQTRAEYNLLAYGSQSSDKAYGGIPFWSDNSESYSTYFYTERPIYRLGQTIFFKGLVRKKQEGSFTTPKAGLAVTVLVEDPDNNKLWEGNLKTNQHGSFNGTLEIPTDGKTGGYQVTIKYPDNTYSYNSFEVAEYRKPEYQVDVIPLQGRVAAGNKIKARIKANYYFGAPVANAKVKYSVYSATDWSGRYKLMPRPSYYEYFDDWDDNYEDSSYAGDYVTEGTANLDENGEAIVEIATKPLDKQEEEPYSYDHYDQRYKIQAEVTDLSRMTVVGSGNVSVTAGNFVLFVQPKKYIYKTGDSLEAEISALDYEGKPVINQKLKVSLNTWIKNKKNETYKFKEVTKHAEVSTDSIGKASVKLPLNKDLSSETYYLSVSSVDKDGKTISDKSSIWLANENSPYSLSDSEAEQEALSVKLDKAVYKPGEVAKAIISAPITGKEGIEAIVSIEGIQLHNHKIVALSSTAQLIEIPILSSYAPNVYLTVTMVGKKHQLYTQSQMLKISPEEHFLNLKVETDKQKYKPGETVNYTIKATYQNGEPAKNIELSLGVVDESIYAIRPDSAEDLKKFFFKRLENAVITLSSFPEEYSGGPDKIEPRLRKDFKDVAAWLPELYTNEQGIANASIVLPDNLTSWRATIRGISTGVDVGVITQNIVSIQDILIRLALPRFFTQYDEGLLTAIVHNYSDQEQKIDLSLKPLKNIKVKEDYIQKMKIAPQEAKRFSWHAKSQEAGQEVITVEAIGQTAGDAIEVKLPIKPLGINAFDIQTGLLNRETDSKNISLTQLNDDARKQAFYQLSLSASSLGQVLGNLNKLIDYPYGCTEQTMSRLMPSVIAIKINKTLNLKTSTEDQKRFAEVYKKGIIILKENQHLDGGWGWWKYDDSNPYLTSYVLEGLYLLKDAGYFVEQASIDNGLKWLKDSSERLRSQLNDPQRTKIQSEEIESLINLSYSDYVLSLFKTDNLANKSVQTFWESKLYELTPESLAYLTLALNNSGQKSFSGKVAKRLINIANTNGDFIDWDHTNALMKRLNINSKCDYTYRFTGTESTALALRALLVTNTPKETIEKVKNWLLLQRDKDGWNNTKTSAQVFKVLVEEELTSNIGSTKFLAAIKLSEDLTKELEFNEQNKYENEKVFSFGSNDLNFTNLNIQKNGIGRLYFSSLLTYILPLKPGMSIPHKSIPEGLQIKRSFYRLVPTPVGKEGKIRFVSKPIFGNSIKAGETLLMKITVDSPIQLPYVLLEAPLPSGGEVISNDPRENLLENNDENSDSDGDWGDWWWSQQDILDDKIAYFARDLPAGKSEMHALIRMELPGTVNLNPVYLEGMYTKKVRAYSALSKLKITE